MVQNMKKTLEKTIKKVQNAIKKFSKKPLKYKISVIAAALVIFVVLFWSACELFGGPVAKIRVIAAAKDYIEENMPGMEADRSFCKYDRERDVYYIEFTPEGRIHPFILEFNEDGKLTKDGYTLDYVYSDIYER